MNRPQQIVIGLAGIVIAAMFLAPPWTERVWAYPSNAIGYHPVWAPPTRASIPTEDLPDGQRIGHLIDVGRLFLQVAAVAICSAVIVGTMSLAARKEKPAPTVRRPT